MGSHRPPRRALLALFVAAGTAGLLWTKASADEPLVASLEAGIVAGDALAVARAVHKLKSSSAILGADGLAAQCAELETAARNGRLDDGAVKLAAAIIADTHAFRAVAQRAHARVQARLGSADSNQPAVAVAAGT